MKSWESFTDTEKALTREISSQSLEFFSRAMFRFQEGAQMKRNWHISLICDELEKVVTGETECLILNVPPGSGKTHVASVSFPAWCYANEERCRFLTVSYSADLVKNISTLIRDTVIDGVEYQEMWPLTVSKDSNEKSHWQLVDDKGRRTGSFKCASSGGSITGFRAGKLATDRFYGSLVMDDCNKPIDMLTPRKREKSNEIWDTVRSRMASPKTPTVMIQQRLHVEDATGFKLKGMVCVEDLGWCKTWKNRNGSGKTWRQIIVPALIDDDYLARLPEKYQRCVTGMLYGSDEQGRYSYWPEKETLDTLLDMEASNSYMFVAQYQQKPIRMGGTLFKEGCFESYYRAAPPKFEWRFIVADTAQKTNEWNDYSVIGVWGVYNGCIYLIEAKRGKWESPKLKAQFLRMVAEHADKNAYDDDQWGRLRGAWVEDASSGTGLIQDIRHGCPIPINPKKTHKLGKGAHAMDTVLHMANDRNPGRIFIPEDVDYSWYITEHYAFTIDQTHDHDDCVDVTMHACDIGIRREMLMSGDDSTVGIAGSDEAYIF